MQCLLLIRRSPRITDNGRSSHCLYEIATETMPKYVQIFLVSLAIVCAVNGVNCSTSGTLDAVGDSSDGCVAHTRVFTPSYMRQRTNLLCSSDFPATCETCEPGAMRDFTYLNLTVHLGNSSLYTLDAATFSLRQTLSLNKECVLRELRPSVDDPGKFYLPCRSIHNPAYQQVIYNPETEEFDAVFVPITGIDLPPSEKNGIVVSVRTVSGLEDIFMWIDFGEIYVRSLSRLDTIFVEIYDGVQCDQWDEIYPFPPSSQLNKLQFILDCTDTTTSAMKRYLMAVDLHTSQVDPKALETSGAPFASPDGDYLLFVNNTIIKMVVTSNLEQYGYEDFNGRIQETKFLRSDNKLYLAVIIPGETYKVIDVSVFVNSGGNDGIASLTVSPHCMDTACLPHGLTETGSSDYITSSKNGNVYQVVVFNLTDSTQGATFEDILDKPAAVHFRATPTLPATSSPKATPTTTSSPNAMPTTTSSPNATPTTTPQPTSVVPSDQVERTSTSTTTTTTGLPSVESKHDTHTVAIVFSLIAAICVGVIVIAMVCSCIICKRSQRKRQGGSLEGETPKQVEQTDTGKMCIPNSTFELLARQLSCKASVTVVVDPDELTSSAYSSKPSSMSSSRASTPLSSSQGDLNTSGVQHLFQSPQACQTDLHNASTRQHLHPNDTRPSTLVPGHFSTPTNA